jgi:hypothetical protein
MSLLKSIMAQKWVVGVLLLVVAFLLLVFSFNDLTGFAILGDTQASDFNLGTFHNTTFNGSAVVLDGDNLTGTFTSRIFNTTTPAYWNNFSWAGTALTFFVRSCDDASCSGDAWNQILLESPSNLIVGNQTYFQYLAVFSNQTSTLIETSVDYTVLPLALAINISSPMSESVYGYNDSIEINYTVGPYTPAACWYTLDGSGNVTLPGCTNAQFGVATNGTHTLTLYANASDGTLSVQEAIFDVYTGAPTVLLISPNDGAVSNSTVQFNYYVNNSELTGCSLLANFGGSWGASDTDSSPTNGGFNSFNTGAISDGNYNWGVECNDIAAQASETMNRSIIIDKIKPAIAVSEPAGTFTSKKDIPINLSVVDATTTTCIYSLTKVGFGSVLVVVMPQCQSTSFNVADDGDYALTVTVTDAGGNSNSQTSNFVVQSSGDSGTASSGSSGGGGGGGVSVNVGSLVVPRLTFAQLPTLNLRPGAKESFIVELVNSGNTFLNGCHIVGPGSYASWISSSDSVSLGSGQHGWLNVSLVVPRDTRAGNEPLQLEATCDEFSQTGDIGLTVLPAEFLFDFISYSREGTRLVVDYSLQELAGRAQSISLAYILKGLNNVEVTSGTIQLQASASQTSTSTFSFELPKDAYGEFSLVLSLDTGSDHMDATYPVFLGSSRTTGFVISDSNRKTLSIWGVILIVLVGAYFIWYFIRKKRAQSSKI